MASSPYNAPMQTPPAQQSHLRMLHIKEIDIMSAGTLNGAFGVCIGVIVGVIFALFNLLAVMMGAGNAGIVMAIGALFVFPLIYGVLAFIGGLVGALIYNLVAGMAGGIRIKVET